MSFELPTIFDGLQQCCVEKTCIADFQHLPERLVSRERCPPMALLYDKDKFCHGCGLPSRHAHKIRDVLEDKQEDVANVMYDNGFKALFPGNTLNICIQYKVSNRMFQRVSTYSSCRRNVLNVVAELPYNNCYITHHQIYRYAPQYIGTEQLVIRILREAVGLFEEAIDDDYPEFYCTC